MIPIHLHLFFLAGMWLQKTFHSVSLCAEYTLYHYLYIHAHNEVERTTFAGHGNAEHTRLSRKTSICVACFANLFKLPTELWSCIITITPGNEIENFVKLLKENVSRNFSRLILSIVCERRPYHVQTSELKIQSDAPLFLFTGQISVVEVNQQFQFPSTSGPSLRGTSAGTTSTLNWTTISSSVCIRMFNISSNFAHCFQF